MWICLHCFEAICGAHVKNHDKKHAVKANVKTGAAVCDECGLHLESLLKADKATADPVYEAKLEAFLGDILSAFGLKNAFDREVEPEKEDEAVKEEKEENSEVMQEMLKAEKEKILSRMKAMCISPGIKGLKNLGNTCYFNSVMQCLNASQDFVELILTSDLSEDEKSGATKLPMRKRVIEFLFDMRKKSEKFYNPASMLDAIRGRCLKFRGTQQQDAHELLMTLLDKLIDEEQKLMKVALKMARVELLQTAVGSMCGCSLANKSIYIQV